MDCLGRWLHRVEGLHLRLCLSHQEGSAQKKNTHTHIEKNKQKRRRPSQRKKKIKSKPDHVFFFFSSYCVHKKAGKISSIENNEKDDTVLVAHTGAGASRRFEHTQIRVRSTDSYAFEHKLRRLEEQTSRHYAALLPQNEKGSSTTTSPASSCTCLWTCFQIFVHDLCQV